MLRTFFYTGLAVLFASSLLAAQELPTGFVNRTVTVGSEQYGYQVYVPRDYTPGSRLPVILFLHGGGETGDDGLIQTEGALGDAVRRSQSDYPAVIVFPQCAPGRIWATDDMANMALGALEDTEEDYGTDPNRVYVTGLSRGGQGAWFLAYRNPDRFAALLVIAGRVANTGEQGKDGIVPAADGEPFAALAGKIAGTPTWIFHGEIDGTTEVEESRNLVAALEKIGATKFRYTEMPGSPHNVWDAAYRSPGVIDWLFSQRRSAR